MDQVTLVSHQLEDGERLLQEMAKNNITVTSAFWAKTIDDGGWYLYIATPIVDTEGPRGAYRRLHAAMRQFQTGPFWVEPFDVKLIGAHHAMAEAAAKLRGAYPGITRSGSTPLGGVMIEGAYIYPPIVAQATK